MLASEEALDRRFPAVAARLGSIASIGYRPPPGTFSAGRTTDARRGIKDKDVGYGCGGRVTTRFAVVLSSGAIQIVSPFI
jgi:hypothetical protein